MFNFDNMNHALDVFDTVQEFTSHADKESMMLIQLLCYLLGSVQTEEERNELLKKMLSYIVKPVNEMLEFRDELMKEKFFHLGTFYQELAKKQREDDFDINQSWFFEESPISLVTYAEKEVKSSIPVDVGPDYRFLISRDDLLSLELFVYGNLIDAVHVPSDFLVEGCIPFPDMELVVDRNTDDGVCHHSMRVVLFPWYQDYMKLCQDDDLLVMQIKEKKSMFFCGCIDIRYPDELEDKGFVFRFGFVKGCDYLILDSCPYTYGLSDDILLEAGDVTTFGSWYVLASKYLKSWYVLQWLGLQDFGQSLFQNFNMVKDKRRRVSGVKISKISRKQKQVLINHDLVDIFLQDVPKFEWHSGHWEEAENEMLNYGESELMLYEEKKENEETEVADRGSREETKVQGEGEGS